ncbi:MAG: hypothetical protein L6R19_16210 [Alphaproteobacteria bacterium]|nr:hypothetical protein [Alphaproteobacteria bacterium]
MCSDRFPSQAYFLLEGPSEPQFLSRILQVLQLRDVSILSFECARNGDAFAVSIVLGDAHRCRLDVLAALLRRIVGVVSLRWHVEAKRAEQRA